MKELKATLSPNSSQRVLSVSVDTGSSQEKVTKALAPAVLDMGPVDVLVNCAGDLPKQFGY